MHTFIDGGIHVASDDELKSQLNAYLEGWRTGDKENWLRLFADDAVVEDPVATPPHVGKQAIAAFWDLVHQMPMKFEPQLQRSVICGSEGMLQFRMVTSAEGGPKLAMDIVDIFTFDSTGLITSLKAYWDADSSTMVE